MQRSLLSADLSLTLLLAALFLVDLSGIASANTTRFALVIGNSDYEHVTDLANPSNDASDIAMTLDRLGFSVTVKTDLSRSDMSRALREFRVSTIGAEQALIYFAGHGLEIDRENYLVPVDARLAHDFDVEFEAVRLEDVVSATSGASKLGLVILDACRDNPFLAQMKRASGTRSIGRGLSLVEPTGNTLVAYAARAGTVASDGTGRNSPYAEALIETFARPELEIVDAFRIVRDKVLAATGGQQEPFVYGSLSAERIFLAAQPEKPASTPVVTTPAPGQDQASRAAIELAFWQAIADSDNPDDFQDYLDRFPNGTFNSLSKRKLAALSKPSEQTKTEQPPRTSGVASTNEVRPESSEPVKLSRSQARDLQARLNILGLDAGTEDGLIGPRTMRAVAAFRSANNLGTEEVIDAETLTALSEKVPEPRLAAYQTGKVEARQNQAETAETKQNVRETSPSGAQSFVGKTYCLRVRGQLLNGRDNAGKNTVCRHILQVKSGMVRFVFYDDTWSYLKRERSEPLSHFQFPASGTDSFVYLPKNSTVGPQTHVKSRVYNWPD